MINKQTALNFCCSYCCRTSLTEMAERKIRVFSRSLVPVDVSALRPIRVFGPTAPLEPVRPTASKTPAVEVLLL